MSKDEYIVWDFSMPGITFSEKYGRITVFKKTMELIGFPEYYRFLFNQDAGFFAIQACRIDDDGAQRISDVWDEDAVEIKSMDLVRYIYRCSRWSPKRSYRIAGEVYRDERIVKFTLSEAMELHEGRLKVRGG